MAAGPRLIVVLAALALAAAGCGDSSPSRPDGGGPRETADRRPALPAGWRRVVNRGAGFSLGIPPGWTARGVRGATLVRSADRALAVSIAADRSAQGRRLRPRAYARRTLRSLRGYGRVRTGASRRVRAHYPAAAVSGRGRYRRTRVRQAITAIALQRPRQVTFSLLVFRNAAVAPGVYDAAVAEMVRTFRGQPPRF